MRLIDADALVETLQSEPKYSIELPANIGDAIQKLLNVHQKMVVDVVNKQPLSYDMEKVVAEIRKNSGVGYIDVDGDYVPPLIKTEEVIDIVKGGGIE